MVPLKQSIFHIIYLFTVSDKDHYDLIVIGGGSGGLACSKEGNVLDMKVKGQMTLILKVLFSSCLHFPITLFYQIH
jgi:hypothetical protein